VLKIFIGEEPHMGQSIPRRPLGTNIAANDLDAQPTQPMRRVINAAIKVPEIAAIFWIIKVLTTGMGETTSDFLVHQIDPVLAVAIAGVCFFAALALQLRVRRYVPWIYWLAVVMVAIFGTMVADAIHIVLGVPYLISVIFFSIALTGLFIAWYATEKTLSIHSIYTLRRELFYWTTIVTTFALGTAIGDLTATTLPAVGNIATTTGHLGYFMSGVLFAILFILPAVGYWLFGLNRVFAFWFAYIMTRPFGASFADWFGRPKSFGGMGLGTGLISLILAGIIIVLVSYLSVTHKDVQGITPSRRG
jgi:uncharacterized membrane-anchored protein